MHLDPRAAPLVDQDLDQIDPVRALTGQRLSCPLQTRELGAGETEAGSEARTRPSGLDLGQHQRLPFAEDEVDLTPARQQATREQAQSLLAEVIRRQLLARQREGPLVGSRQAQAQPRGEPGEQREPARRRAQREQRPEEEAGDGPGPAPDRSAARRSRGRGAPG